MDLVEHRRLLNSKGSDSEMKYELTKPKLIVDYTVAEQKIKYEFTTADYPDLAKCRWIYMYVNNPSKPTNQPWGQVHINGSEVYGIETAMTCNVVMLQTLNGLWSVCGFSTDNANYAKFDRGLDFKRASDLSTFIAYSPIERIALISYTKFLLEKTQIKIYGYY